MNIQICEIFSDSTILFLMIFLAILFTGIISFIGIKTEKIINNIFGKKKKSAK